MDGFVMSVTIENRLANYVDSPRNTKTINGLADLPIPEDKGDGRGTAYHLDELFTYNFGSNVVFEHPIALPNERCILSAEGPVDLIYIGGGAFIRGLAGFTTLSIEIDNLAIFGTGFNSFLDIPTASELSIYRLLMAEMSIGDVANCEFIAIERSTFANVRGSLNLNNCLGSYFRAIAFQTDAPFGDAFLKISGTSFSNGITNCQFIPVAGDSALYLDPCVWRYTFS
jgi:hypothetical protein